MNNFPFIGPGGMKEQHRRAARPTIEERLALYKECKKTASLHPVLIITKAGGAWEGAGRVAHAKALIQERKRHENLIVGALDSWGASPQAVYRAVMTYDNR